MDELQNEAKWAKRKRQAQPSLKDYRRDLPKGSVRVKENPDGTCEGKIVGKAALHRLVEMNAEWRRHEVEQGAEMNARIPSETLIGPNGTIVVPAAQAEKKAKRAGLRPKIFWGRGKRYRVLPDGTHERIA